MSTIDIEKQQIKSRLMLLGEESLNRSHNSLNLSFAQMLAYINNLIKNLSAVKLSEEIKCLVETYQLMAEKFYIQFELSLLDEIVEQRDIQLKSNRLIEKLQSFAELSPGKLSAEEFEKASELLNNAHVTAATIYQDLVERFPALLQEAVDKLKIEWQRLDTIVASNQALIRDKELLRALEAVVQAAAYSVGIEKDRIVLVPGNAFSLYFFSYLDNLAVLTVPIHSVRAPWEWSIFWHELAGYKVRQLKSNLTIERLKANLKNFHNIYRREEKQSDRDELLEVMTHTGNGKKEELAGRRNLFARRYMADLLSRPKLVLRDLGSLEHQFEQVLKNLKMKNRFQTYDEIKKQGWCVDWFEELFEDSFSVMAIGAPFLEFFSDILRRHQDNDGRHPPLDVRLSVANVLLNLMNSEDEPGQPTTIEESVAQQILKFTSLLTMATHPLPQNDEADSKFDWTTLDAVRYELPEAVGIEIGLSIQEWSHSFLSAKDRFNDAKVEAQEFIKMFSSEGLEYIAIYEGDRKSEPAPSYESLLEGKNYEGLLDLSFYDRDFFSGTDVKNVERLVKLNSGLSGWQSVFSIIQSTRIVDSLLTQTGTIRFKINNTEYQTTVTNWDMIFPQGSTYYIQP